jgi:hypothetical protein
VNQAWSGRQHGMDTSPSPDLSTPDASDFDGGRPDVPPDERPDVLFPDTLAPRAYEEGLPRADEADAIEQQADVTGPDDEEDVPRD